MVEQGDEIGGRYRVERFLGEGGMAAVWLAHDRTLDRPVAVKFLYLLDARKRQAATKAFLREARLAASVVHRNVVQVLDFGLHSDQTPFMVMEALSGETLGDQFNAGAQYSLGEVVSLGVGVLEGLAAVHDAGIVHRDLKPENIFMAQTRDGVVPKLLDFGISRSLDTTGRRASAVTTVAGRVLGTPEYMSPEQANGATEVTPRSDVYAAGVIFYETIVGDVPYRGQHLGGLILKITQGGAPPVIDSVPEVGQPVSDLIAKAMSCDPAERYADASEMLRAFRAATAGTLDRPATTMPPRVRERAPRTVDSTLDLEAAESAGTSTDLGDVALATTEWRLGSATSQRSPEARGGSGPPGSSAAFGLRALQFWLPLGLSVVAVATTVVWLLRGPAPGEPAERFIVVKAATGAALDASAQSLGTPQAAVDDEGRTPPMAPVAGEPPGPTPQKTVAPKSAATSNKKRVRRKPPEATVTRAFERQKSAVVRCLDSHASATLPKLAVRMTLAAGGRVSRAELLPKTVARTDLGGCIERAVGNMRFPAESKAATYRVPLVARAAR